MKTLRAAGFLLLAAATSALPGRAERWEPFSPDGTFAIQYVGSAGSSRGYYLSNPLAAGGKDWDAVRLVGDYDAVACAWNLNDEGGGDISVRNTQGGINGGDYIMKDSKIRLASTVNFVQYRANQTFKFYRDAEAGDEAPVVAVMSNAEQNRFWTAHATDPLLSYAVSTTASAASFRLVPLYHYEDFRRLLAEAAEALADEDHTYGETERAELEACVEQTGGLLKAPGYPKTEADALLERLRSAVEAFKATGAIKVDTDFGAMSPAERAGKVVLALTGELSAEDFAIIRSDMIRLRELDLSGVSNTALPVLAFAGMGTLEKVTLPAGLEEIGAGAFADCRSLSAIQLPAGLKVIGNMAFARSGLERIEIGAVADRIGRYAFAECRSLTAITVDGNNAAYRTEGGVLFDKPMSVLIHCPAQMTGELRLPESLRRIEPYACTGCGGLTGRLELPAALSEVGDWAFAHCTGFEGELQLPAALRSVGRNAFFGCTGLTGTLELPAAAVAAAPGVFAYLSSVETLVLPASVQRLPESLFECCGKVSVIRSAAAVPPLVGPFALRGIDRECTFVDVDADVRDSYRAAPVWQEFANYSEKFTGYERFAVDGTYLIQYVGDGADGYIAYNAQGNGAATYITEMDGASKWELAFFDATSPALPFGTGKATDISYRSGSLIYHINMAGQSYADAASGYERRDNRTFAIWLAPGTDLSAPTVAIQGNGTIWRLDGQTKAVRAEAYSGKFPRSTDFVWRLVNPELTGIGRPAQEAADGGTAAVYYDLGGRRIDRNRRPKSGIYLEYKNGRSRKIML